ncbi:MAG: AI-2E family transporter [Elusimicrobiota bacterium]|jgi:predicted PurR-regulated permease PerM|nr:AI-2E family transporter [Elusimicrobiota bacterium]
MFKKKTILISLIIAVVLLFNMEFGKTIVERITQSFLPVFIGVIGAMILNAPVNIIEKHALARIKSKKLKRGIALLITLCVCLGIIILIALIVVPRTIESIEEITKKISEVDTGVLRNSIKENKLLRIVFEKIAEFLKTGADAISNILTTCIGIIKDTVRATINLVVGLVFAILIMLNKDRLKNLCKEILQVIFKKTTCQKILAIITMVAEKISRFIGGQIIESVLFGGFCYLAFLIFKIPHGSLLAIIVGFGNIIPIIGAYFAGATGFLIVLTENSKLAFVFLAIVIVIQQIEQFTTYPLVVGRHVGLSPFWMFFSVVVFGRMFGFWGLLLGVPVATIIDNIVKVMILNCEKSQSQDKKKVKFHKRQILVKATENRQKQIKKER